jgi:DNA-binding MltR family transcriptional regulator
MTNMALNDELIEILKRENEHFFKACDKESDRGLALVAAEFFDSTLERLLLSRFAAGVKQRPKMINPLFEGFGPLSTFSAKISVSFAIELLQNWMAADLDRVRRIRNEFAHSLESKTFLDPTIRTMVGQLEGLTQLFRGTEDQRKILEGPARLQFALVCTRIGALLQAKVVVLESDGTEEMKRTFMTNPQL